MEFTRNETGTVVAQNEHGVATAQIPQNRSALGLIAVNGLINGGVYKEDGWVYLAGKPVRKWHIRFDNIKLWEPKLKDVVKLYWTWKRAQAKSHECWNRTSVAMHKIWKGKGKAIAHVKPFNHLALPGNISYFEGKDPWWEFRIDDWENTGRPSIGFDWLEKKPKKLAHHNIGKELYALDLRRDDLGKRRWKAQVVFYEAMKRSLPKATENKILTLTFGEDTFIFIANSKGPHIHWWEMMDDRYKLETVKVI